MATWKNPRVFKFLLANRTSKLLCDIGPSHSHYVYRYTPTFRQCRSQTKYSHEIASLRVGRITCTSKHYHCCEQGGKCIFLQCNLSYFYKAAPVKSATFVCFFLRSYQWRGGQGGRGAIAPPAGLKNRGATEHKGRQQLNL